MHKLVPVEEAKALMNEAKDWSVWHWLTDKHRVRATADRATEALDELEKQVKSSWNDDLKKAYGELEAEARMNGNPKARAAYEKAKQEARRIDPQIKLVAGRVKEADDAAYAARMDAEDTFDEAERRLSTGMAREGAQKAINAWELREKAIRRAEAAARRA
ncbi:MAG TPA: hypothetical protein VFA33_26995 [Bryobacteraceae bacterium]|nr:hypothetical protein [Bryobacteraceae bacterium]